MTIIRKIHLFAGIIMLPWVMMYALSAFTFNHRDWFASRNPENVVMVQPGKEPPKPSSLEKVVPFMMYLHRVSTYPHSGGALRWWWAVMVDGMVLTLVFWGSSGVIMWCQMKRYRLWGVVALSVCFLVSALMIAGMWNPWLKTYWYKVQARKAAAAAQK